MDIFSGLEKLGLGDLGIDDIYSAPEKGAVKIKEDSTKEEQFSEADVLYEKNYVCPVCDAKFQSKTVRSGKIRVVRLDFTDEGARKFAEWLSNTEYVANHDSFILPLRGYFTVDEVVAEWQKGAENE